MPDKNPSENKRREADMGITPGTRPGPGFLENMAEVEPGLFFRVTRKRRQQKRAIERLLEGHYGTVFVTDENASRMWSLHRHFETLSGWEVRLLLRSDQAFNAQVEALAAALVSAPFEKRLVFFQRLSTEELFALPPGTRLLENAAGLLCAYQGDIPLPRVALLKLDPAHLNEIRQTAYRVAHASGMEGRLPGDFYHIVTLERGDDYVASFSTEYSNRLLAVSDEQQRGLALYELEQHWPVQPKPSEAGLELTASSGGIKLISSSGGHQLIGSSDGFNFITSSGGHKPIGYSGGPRRTAPLEIVPDKLRGEFDTKDGVARDPVDCSVYAPPEAHLSDSLIVQVFVHPPEHAKQAEEQAVEFDAESSRRGVASLGTAIERGTKLTFELAMNNVSVDEPVQELTWRGVTDHVTFGIRLPDKLPMVSLVGRVLVSQASIPIGRILFKLRLRLAQERADKLPENAGRATRYTMAFISYASQDRPEVLRRVQMLSAVGIHYFQDVLDLNPGDEWAEELFRRIDESNVMFLFWSSAARTSEWVQKEWRYGLEKKGQDYIRPVIIEGPPIPEPPQELKHLHFSDRLLYFLKQGA